MTQRPPRGHTVPRSQELPKATEMPKELSTKELIKAAELHQELLESPEVASQNPEAPQGTTFGTIKYNALGYTALDFGPLDLGAKLFQEVTFGTTKNTVPNIKPRPGYGCTTVIRPTNRQSGLPAQSGLAMPSRDNERAYVRVVERARRLGPRTPASQPQTTGR